MFVLALLIGFNLSSYAETPDSLTVVDKDLSMLAAPLLPDDGMADHICYYIYNITYRIYVCPPLNIGPAGFKYRYKDAMGNMRGFVSMTDETVVINTGYWQNYHMSSYAEAYLPPGDNGGIQIDIYALKFCYGTWYYDQNNSGCQIHQAELEEVYWP